MTNQKDKEIDIMVRYMMRGTMAIMTTICAAGILFIARNTIEIPAMVKEISAIAEKVKEHDNEIKEIKEKYWLNRG